MRKAEQFQRKIGSVNKKTYFIGKCAILFETVITERGTEIAIIAPNLRTLKRRWDNVCCIPLDISRVQDVAIFALKLVDKKRSTG